MAIHASNASMRRLLIGNVFRLHYAVTELSAELHGIGELISTIATRGAHRNEHDGECHHSGKRRALLWIIEINPGNLGIALGACFLRRCRSINIPMGMSTRPNTISPGISM